MHYHSKYSIGLLSHSDGSCAETPEETLDILADAHFPKHSPVIDVANSPEKAALRAKIGKFKPVPEEWLSLDLIKKIY